MLKGMGPRALQSLALVSEVIYGTPTRFEDPARFSFAHGGKDGHPFPVPVKVPVLPPKQSGLVGFTAFATTAVG